jgi:ribose transport system substrate-binding protein
MPVLSLALAALGCATDDGKEASDALEFALVPKTSNNLVFKIGNDGAQYAARALTSATGRDVNVEYLASPELDPTAEQELIRHAIAAKKDALLVSCIDESITEPIDEAVAAGIPVITYDSDCPDSGRLGFYSMSSEATGAKAADLLAKAMGTGAKNVAILTGRAGSDNLDRRVAGFLDRLAAEYPDLDVVTTVHCDETAETCSAAVEDEIIAQYPELDGLMVVGLWGLLAACDCSESGLSCLCDDSQMPSWKAAAKGKLKTVAFDSLPFELMLMEQGYVSALVGQKYFGWGYDTVSLMYEHLADGREVDGFIDSGFDVVCPNHVEEMSAKWQAADFRTPLAPECEL